MKHTRKRHPRTFVPSASFALEGRVVLSTFGPGHPALHQTEVGPSVHVEHHAALPRPHRAVHVATHSSHHPTTPTARRWSWLNDTYWYVPNRNLPAVLFNSSTGTLAPVSDQTVYHITGYREGYFWGKTVTQLGSSSASSSALVGSVTPQGKLLLSFTSTGSSSSPSVTEGYGTMQRKSGQWTMENQMFTSPSQTLQIGHWAYMVQTRPGLPSWRSLPSSGLSVPQFLSQYEGIEPQPIGT